MQYLYQQHGEQVYNAEYLAETEQEITAWCETQGIALNNKNKTKLLDIKTWENAAALFRRHQHCSSILAQPNLMISTNSNKRSKMI